MEEYANRIAEAKVEAAVEAAAEEKRLDTLFDTIKNLMQSMRWTADQAMAAMQVSQADQVVLVKRLG